VSQIPDAVREEIKTLVQADFQSYRIRNFITHKHNLPALLPSVWSSLIRSIKNEMGIQSAGDDLKALIERLTEERNERGAVFDFVVDGDLSVTTIFFMSGAMVESFRRCAQFAVMDSTCKTNRFGMNLFLVCGVDEHMHIVLYASAFMKDETQPSFEYVLTQIKRAVGLDAWLRMACVATDGCAAMTAALTKVAPQAAQQRCVWHLQQNIIKHTGGSSHQNVIKAWYQCVYARSDPEFESKWAELLQVSMSEKCRDYLVKYILPLRVKWACSTTNQLTNFGSHSTQLVESLNRLLKMWDVDDRTSLSRAITRICTVKEEEQTRRQISSMRDHALLAVGQAKDSETHSMDWTDSYKVKLKKYLSGAAAKLCEVEYELCSQYKATQVYTVGLFSLATSGYIIKHKIKENSEYQVHVSPYLIYCPCGHCFTYLLPCRHVLAANLVEFNDIFQPGQYHPRWTLQYSIQLQQNMLAKQFWVSVGREVTAEGVQRVQYVRVPQEQEVQEAHSAESDATTEDPLRLGVPLPMYDPSIQHLVPSQMTPQHLYHMIEGECQNLRQLVCTNPTLLSGMVWMGLHQLKMNITAHIDREQRSQHHAAVFAAAAVQPDAYTSESIPLSSLMAPVPLTAVKAGRPSHKRALAAMEGVASRKVRALIPSHLLVGVTPRGVGVGGSRGVVVEDVESNVHVEVEAVVAAASSATAAASSNGASNSAWSGVARSVVVADRVNVVDVEVGERVRKTARGRVVHAPACRD
jgi:hypothetical protein